MLRGSAVQILILTDSFHCVDVEGGTDLYDVDLTDRHSFFLHLIVTRYVLSLIEADGSVRADKWGEVDSRCDTHIPFDSCAESLCACTGTHSVPYCACG